MTRFDFSPLFRSTVGYDRVMHALEANSRAADEGYPPYNIEALSAEDGADKYRITMAVAGFAESDLDVTLQNNTLVISGRSEQAEETPEEGRFLYRGIARRAFERRFELAERCGIGVEAGIDRKLRKIVWIIGRRIGREAAGGSMFPALIHRQDHHLAGAGKFA